MTTRLIEFDSYNSEEGPARDEARNKLGSQARDSELHAVDSGPGPGFGAGGPMTHWVFQVAT